MRGWLVEHGLSFAELGCLMGITGMAASNLFKTGTARPERVEQLKALGIPDELLPEPKYTPPGPKPRR